MDVTRLTYYDTSVPLFKNGKLTPDSVIAQGTAPHTVGYVDAPGATTFAAGETGWFTMVPTIYNADTLGIRPDLVGRDISTWADIMDPSIWSDVASMPNSATKRAASSSSIRSLPRSRTTRCSGSLKTKTPGRSP